MCVLLAVGNDALTKRIAEYLTRNGVEVKTCYNRLAVVAAVKEYASDTVVLSPFLPGEGDLVTGVVQPLRDSGVRVLLLPGDVNMPDARELIKQVLPHGVYDFVYDPVTPEKVLERLNNPGKRGDVPAEIIRAAMLEEKVSGIVPDIVVEEEGGNRWGLLGKLAKKRRWKNSAAVQTPDAGVRRRAGDAREGDAGQSVPGSMQEVPAMSPKERPAEISPVGKKELSRQKEVSVTFPIPEDFAVLGSEEFPSVRELCAALPGDYSAVVVPAGWPGLADAIRELRRNPAASALPIVVVGPCDAAKCYAVGADECVEGMDPGTVERVRAKAARMKEMWKQAERDPLTGLYNRRFLEKYLSEQERRYQETGTPFALMMADLDRFKSVNDTYGHQAGDEVLKKFAAFLAATVRPTDVVTRYGGEEFVVVFPGISNARAIAERLCREWSKEEIKLPGGGTISSTFSAGLAVMGRNAQDAQGLISAADRALYQAKEAGRNRVAVSEPPGERPIAEDSVASYGRKITFPLKLPGKKRNNVIMVISGEGGGKTTIAVNLAVALTLKGYAVAFIDGDLESLAAHYLVDGVPAGKSLLYALERPKEAAEFLEPVPLVPQLCALTADPGFVTINGKLSSKLTDVIGEVSPLFDFVVVDTPPEMKKVQRLVKMAGRTVVVVSPDEYLDGRLKLPKPVLVLNRWPEGMDVSLGEELYGLRTACVIPDLREIPEAERHGMPAVLGCQLFYRVLSELARQMSTTT